MNGSGVLDGQKYAIHILSGPLFERETEFVSDEGRFWFDSITRCDVWELLNGRV